MPWICLIRIKPIWLYQPRPRGPTGYFAEQWKLDKPIWDGELRLMAKDDDIRIQFYAKDGNLFCESIKIPLRMNAKETKISNYVEKVRDSSRYFVITIEIPKTKKKALMGFGFNPGDSAFDFNAALQDRVRTVNRHGDDVPDTNEEEEDDTIPAPPTVDLSLKGSITIKMGNLNANQDDDEGETTNKKADSAPKGSDGGFLLAPPEDDETNSLKIIRRFALLPTTG